MKTREARPPYEIPLLCDFGAFSNSLHALREAQGGRVRSASECNHRYAKPLRLALRRLYPMAPKVHALRSFYMAFVMSLYEAECTFNIAAMRALGHTTWRTRSRTTRCALSARWSGRRRMGRCRDGVAACSCRKVNRSGRDHRDVEHPR